MKRDNTAVQELADAMFASVESYLDATLRKHDSTVMSAVMAALDERIRALPVPQQLVPTEGIDAFAQALIERLDSEPTCV